jgi:hypothetical protein
MGFKPHRFAALIARSVEFVVQRNKQYSTAPNSQLTTAHMCPAREHGAFESRLPALTAALLGVHFLCRERRVQKRLFLKFLLCSFLCSLQRNEPKKGRPATRPAAALTKDMFTAAARTRTFGRSNSVPPAPVPMPFVRHRCNGFLKHRILNIQNGCRIRCGMTGL